jgi:hypothetical protein
MAKQVSVEIEVNSSQVDQTVQKLGQLKDLGKGLKIQYDIDGRPIDVAIDKSLNLQKQVKILTAELRRTKEGTAEFQMLSSRLGQAQDELAKTTAKSKDLFSSLSMIPGPVGQFFSQLQGGIELLKTFSSFTFKDLQFQFKETANDIADIGKNLTDIDSNVIDDVSKSTDNLGDSFKSTATTAGSLTNAIQSSQDKWVNYDKAVGDLQKSTGALITQYPKMINGVEVMTDAIRMSDGSIRSLSQSELLAINSGKALTITTEGLVVAEKAATFWTSTLGTTIKTVLISTGILAAIVVLGELVAMLYRYVSGTEESEAATRSFTNALEEQQKALQNDLDAIDMSNKAILTRAKIAGESEEEITKKTKEGNAARLAELFRYNGELEGEQDRLKNNTKINNEDREKLSKDINDKLRKNSQDITKQILANEQFRLDELLNFRERLENNQ